jgi:aminoglycoside/choline kinase family phosphotransferase
MTLAEPIAWPDEGRRLAFERWLAGLAAAHGLDPSSVAPASADASFRRYLRIRAAQGDLIVMDAPPQLEDCRPFVKVAGMLQQAGLNAPRILAWDEPQGFMLLSDLGHRLYLGELQSADAATADRLMRDAIAALVRWQQHTLADGSAQTLPPYDEALLTRELELFPAWCVQREFGVTWGDAQQAQWQAVSRALLDSALAQPRVAVHRDYMPRNLMVGEPNPAILDFQDPWLGPVSYDMASLLRDAFISWDEEREIDWAVRYWQAARAAQLPVPDDFAEFWRALEWMGAQRHLKVLGIFCRLKHRDGKPRYSQDLPRFFAYLRRVAMRYPAALAPLLALIEPLDGGGARVGYTF